MGKESKNSVYEITTVLNIPVWRRSLHSGSRVDLDFREVVVGRSVKVGGIRFNQTLNTPTQVVSVGTTDGLPSVQYSRAGDDESIVLVGHPAIKAERIRGKTLGGRSVKIR